MLVGCGYRMLRPKMAETAVHGSKPVTPKQCRSLLVNHPSRKLTVVDFILPIDYCFPDKFQILTSLDFEMYLQ